LHSESITHRDVKPENIFVIENSSLEVKIGDIGLANIDEDLKVRFKHIKSNYSLINVFYFYIMHRVL